MGQQTLFETQDYQVSQTGLKVRDLPASERPVNRVRAVGPENLSTFELIAAVLGTPDALNQAQQVIGTFERLGNLVQAKEEEITTIDGLGPSSAARLQAALELSRRMMRESLEDKFVVRSPADVAQYLMAEMGNLEQEHFKVLMLDTRNRVLADKTLYIGSLNASHIRVCEVFRDAIRRNAAAIIVVHNHPSGDPTPSPEDVEATRQILAGGLLVDIDLLDHLIIGKNRFVSLRERGLGFEDSRR